MPSTELYNREAEALVLAAMLRYPDDYYTINDVGLQADDFLDPENKRVAKALFETVEEKTKPEIPLVIEGLRLGGHDETVDYVTELTTAPCSAAQAKEYARTVKGLSVNRQIANVGVKMIEISREKRSDYEGALAESERLLRKVADQTPAPEKSPLPTDIIRRVHSVVTQDRIPLSLAPTLQTITGGLTRGHFWAVGGFSSTGKSAFGINLVADVLKTRGKRVAIFSTEMTQEQFMIRLMSLKSGIPQHNIQNRVTVGFGKELELANAIKDIEKSPVRIYDEINTLSGIRSESRRLKDHEGLDVIVVDFLQNVIVTGDEVKDAREVALGLQMLAKELDITVIALSQLSNSQAQADDAAGGQGEYYSLKGHGAIRDAADLVILLRRRRREGSPVLKVQVAKNRHGPLAEFECEIELATGKIEEATFEYTD